MPRRTRSQACYPRRRRRPIYAFTSSSGARGCRRAESRAAPCREGRHRRRRSMARQLATLFVKRSGPLVSVTSPMSSSTPRSRTSAPEVGARATLVSRDDRLGRASSTATSFSKWSSSNSGSSRRSRYSASSRQRVLASNTSPSLAEMGAESDCTSSTRWPYCYDRRNRPHARDAGRGDRDGVGNVARKLRKRGVVTKDAPAGFVVNRGARTTSPHGLARAWQQRRGDGRGDHRARDADCPVRPAAARRPRVANHVLETMHEAYPDRFPTPPTLANFADGEGTEVVVVGPPTLDGGDHPGRARGAGRRDRPSPRRRGGRLGAGRRQCCCSAPAGRSSSGGITPHLDQTGFSERVLGRRRRPQARPPRPSPSLAPSTSTDSSMPCLASPESGSEPRPHLGLQRILALPP